MLISVLKHKKNIRKRMIPCHVNPVRSFSAASWADWRRERDLWEVSDTEQEGALTPRITLRGAQRYQIWLSVRWCCLVPLLCVLCSLPVWFGLLLSPSPPHPPLLSPPFARVDSATPLTGRHTRLLCSEVGRCLLLWTLPLLPATGPVSMETNFVG